MVDVDMKDSRFADWIGPGRVSGESRDIFHKLDLAFTTHCGSRTSLRGLRGCRFVAAVSARAV